MRFLSLGAGVQSSTIFLMMCRGELPKADHAIFADTQWEPKEVYKQLDFLKAEGVKVGLPVHVVTFGNIRSDALKAWLPNSAKEIGHAFASMPMFSKAPEGSRDKKGKLLGENGMLRRQCTNRYKIQPVETKMRELLGVNSFGKCKKGSIEQWFGISVDEIQRARVSPRKAIKYFYPFIWEGSSGDNPLVWRRPGFTRQNCLDWQAKNGYPVPPRSACIGCPFHSNAEWRRIRADKEQWADAVAFDKAIRHPVALKGTCYLHNSRVPLDEAPIDADSAGQTMMDECQGMCGI